MEITCGDFNTCKSCLIREIKDDKMLRVVRDRVANAALWQVGLETDSITELQLQVIISEEASVHIELAEVSCDPTALAASVMMRAAQNGCLRDSVREPTVKLI